MREFDRLLHKTIKVVCSDKKIFIGRVTSFGGGVQGEEEYGTAESFLCVDTGDAEYVLFESEVQEIVEL